MKESTVDGFWHGATVILLVAIILVGLALAYPTWRRSLALKAKEDDLKLQIEEKKKEIAQLSENRRRFQTDPSFVEAIARKNRRVFPGELVFTFED